MNTVVKRAGLLSAVGLICLALFSPVASAAEFPYTLDPGLSVRGDCSTSGEDLVADPGCPYSPPPAGPSARFENLESVAIDAYGNEYVASYGNGGTNGRIDIFDDEGRFLTEMANPHGPRSIGVDSNGNLYSLEQVSGGSSELVRYTPTVYNPEQGEIVYNPGSRAVIDIEPNTVYGSVSVDRSNDHIYVSWWGISMTEYDSAQAGNGLLNSINLPGFYNHWSAVDSQRRRLYAGVCLDGTHECVVRVLEADAPYGLIETIDGSDTPQGEFLSSVGALGLAVDEETGHVFVADLGASRNVFEFGADYKYLSKVLLPSAQGSLQIAVSNSALNPSASNSRYLFVPLTFGSGSVLAFEPPEISGPTIKGAVSANISEHGAELRATIDPGVDPLAEPAEYRIEYVSEAEYEATGFDQALTATTGTIPSSAAPSQVSAFAGGLSSGTSYRFRVSAKNSFGDDQEEGTFATFSDAEIAAECPNANLRNGASAALPDCRAYELVTPPDTNGNPTKGAGPAGDTFGMVQSSPLGNAVSFFLLGGTLPGTEATGGVWGDPYRATRAASGWSTAHVGPTGTQTSKPRPGSSSPDQGFNFWIAGGKGSALVNGLEAGYLHYPDGHSELIGRGSLGTDPKATGKLITAGAAHVVFQTGSAAEATPVQLEPAAPPAGTKVVYDRTREPLTGVEQTHVVSLLPGNVTPGAGQNAGYNGASADGNGIAFEVGSTLYLRVGNATTYEIGSGLTFAGVSEGGERVFYLEGGDLFAYDTGTEASIRFSEVGDAVPVNVASDGSRAYFVSEEAISGSGPNPNGAEPQAEEQNLYLSAEGTISFVATVTERDVEGESNGIGTVDGLGSWLEAVERGKPGFDPSRLTPDGGVMLFQSRADLDGYDSGESPQVYRYDSVVGSLHCLSCPPTGSPATGGAALQSFSALDPDAPFGPSGFVQSLRSDGMRALFESSEALVSSDTDGKRDVYEWEAQGVGSCQRPAGCIYLISPGQSPTDEYLFGQSESSDDVFFTTNRALVPGDLSTLSVYDARIDGGFAADEIPGECLGEACQPAATPPRTLTPASAAFQGPGNVKQASSKPRCKKSRAKPRCAKSQAKKKHHKKKNAKKRSRARATQGGRR